MIATHSCLFVCS